MARGRRSVVPREAYERRRRLSNKIAALVLIAPEHAPARSELPRDKVFDPLLKRCLALSVKHRGGAGMACELWLESDASQRYQITQLLMIADLDNDGPIAVFMNLGWYVERLLENEEWIEKLERLAQEASEIQRLARLTTLG